MSPFLILQHKLGSADREVDVLLHSPVESMQVLHVEMEIAKLTTRSAQEDQREDPELLQLIMYLGITLCQRMEWWLS